MFYKLQYIDNHYSHSIKLRRYWLFTFQAMRRLGKKEKAKKDPFEDDEALEPALKGGFEDADQA
jgi:hypothetical protein